MKKSVVIILVLIIIGGGGVIAWRYRQDKQAQEEARYRNTYSDLIPYLSERVDDEPGYLEWSEFSWEGPDANDDHIKQIINDDIMPYYDDRILDSYSTGHVLAISNPRYVIYISNRQSVEDNTLGELFLNNVVSYTGRKNDLLLSMYARFRRTIFSIISTERFHELGMPKLIRQLNRAYSYYGEGEADTDLLQETYNALCGKSDAAVDFPLLSADEGEEEIDGEDNFWVHSFWARRHAENNIPAVRAILNDLWAHYIDDSETVVDESSIHEDVLDTDETDLNPALLLGHLV